MSELPDDTIIFFDLNGVVGQPVFDPQTGMYGSYADTDHLLKSMDYYGVDYSLVSTCAALKSDTFKNNIDLAEKLIGHKRLFPCWFLLPAHTGDFPGGSELTGLLDRYSVRAVRIVPDSFSLCMGNWVFDESLEILQRNRILTILQLPTLGVPVPEREDIFLNRLEKICADFPDLPLVSGGGLRNFYPLLGKYPNLHLSLEWDPHPGLVEDVCRRFGADRLLFGTPFSENASGNSGMPLMMVTYSGISQQEKRLIAGGNLSKLLGLSTNVTAANSSKMRWKPLYAGITADMTVIDIHVHSGSWAPEYKPDYDTPRLRRTMDLLGFSKACINSTSAILGGNHYTGNESIVHDVASDPAALIGFAVINPHFDGVKEYIDNCVRKQGFKGLKIHPRIHRCAVTDPRYIPVWEASAAYGVPVLCHTGQGQAFSEPDQFNEIARKYPGGIFIMAHAGETFAGMLQCIKAMNDHHNLYVDTSGWLFMKSGFLEYFIKHVDTTRILFGSDYSWIDPRYAAATVLFADMEETIKNRIMGMNALRII